MMHWVIEKDIFEEDIYETMISFLDRLSIDYYLVDYMPFTHEIYHKKKIPTDGVVAFGCYGFVKKVKELGWQPGVWLNDNYDYNIWSEKWKEYILNNDGIVYEIGKVPFQEKPFHIRPCHDEKSFNGVVVDWEEFTEIKKRAVDKNDMYFDFNMDHLVVVSSKKKIEQEYRCVVCDGYLVTASLYKQGNTVVYKEVARNDNEELYRFVDSLLNVWQPEKFFVVDVAMTNGVYKVIEMGTLNAAGLYKCDVQKIVSSIENYYERYYND